MSKELDIPIIFISVTDPVEAGIMASLQAPDKNATGTGNVVPMEELFVVAGAIVTNSSEVQSATRTLAAVTDAIYVPIDSTILSAISQIKKSPQNDEL